MASTVHIAKNNFTGGETTPFLDGRTDAAAVQAGCRVLENFIVRPFGGISRRPGTEFIDNSDYDTTFPSEPVMYRLIPFKVSQTETFMLEFGKNYIKPWTTGEVPNTDYVATSQVDSYEFGRGYNKGDRIRLAYPGSYNQSLSGEGYHVVLECKNTFSAANFDTNANNPFKALINDTYTTWSVVSPDLNQPLGYGTEVSIIAPSTSALDNTRIHVNYTEFKNNTEYNYNRYLWINPDPTNYFYQNDLTTYPSRTKTISGVNTGIEALTAASIEFNNSVGSVPISSRIDSLSSGLEFYPVTPTFGSNHKVEYDGVGDYFSNPNTPVQVGYTLTVYDTDPIYGTSEVDVRYAPNFADFIIYGIDSKIATPYSSEEEVKNLQYVQLNDVMFIASDNHPPKRLSRYVNNGVTSWVFEDVPFDFAPVLDVNETQTEVQLQYNVPDWTADMWTTGTTYLSGDVVYENSSPFRFYKCKADHVAAAGNEAGTAGGNSVWEQKSYAVGDRVVNDAGILYTCHTAHSPLKTASSNLAQPGITTGNWALYWNEGTSSQILPTWTANTVYDVNDIVRVNRLTYRCIQKHRSIAPTRITTFDGNSETINTAGNRPGYGKFWSRYWRLGASDYDLGNVEVKLVATNDLFLDSDVNTKMQLRIGIPNYYIQQPLGTLAANAEFGPSSQIFLQGDYLVSTSWTQGSALIGNIILEESLDGVIWATAKEWVITEASEGNISYSGEAPATGAWYRFRGYKKSGGNRSIKLERTDSYLTIPYKITGYVSSTEVTGTVNLPNNQLPPSQAIGVSTKYFYRPAFSPTEGYPRAVTFYENRLWWAGTTKQKGRLWGSGTDDFYNYLVGTKDSDALDLTLAATETNEINWMKAFNKSLVIGTAGEVWTVDSGDTEGPLTPTSARARLRLRVGVSRVDPQITNESLLWVQNSGRNLREFAYRFEADQFTAPDMTLFSSHIARNGIDYSAYQINPEPIWWGISNGELIGLTYNREQQVVAWHRHVTGYRDNAIGQSKLYPSYDRFVCVATTYGSGNVDQVWFITERRNDINGYKIRKIERFHPQTYKNMFEGNKFPENSNANGVYVDCAEGTNDITVDGETTIRIEPQDNIRFVNLRCVDKIQVQSGTEYVYTGRDFWNKVGDDVVTENGATTTTGPSAVTIGNDAETSKILSNGAWVGVPFMSVCIPNHIDVPLQNGTSLARKTRINRIVFNVINSLGGEYTTINGDINSSDPVEMQNFSKRPLFLDNYDKISYAGFIHTDHTLYKTISQGDLPENRLPFTGLTTDQHIDSPHMTDLVFAIVQREPAPLNILSIVQKLEVSGN